MSSCHSVVLARKLAKIALKGPRVALCASAIRSFSSQNFWAERMPERAAPTSPSSRITDYSGWSNDELISRISSLESQLRAQNLQYRGETSVLSNSIGRERKPSPSRRAAPFDASKHSTRPIVLKLAYLGARYNGFEHSNNNFTDLPTIEEVLWKALRKARLISPPLQEGSDHSYEVIWGEERRKKYKKIWAGDTDPKEVLELNWDGCDWSKCGRTDRGVSAFGQVVIVRVRSNRPISKEKDMDGETTANSARLSNTATRDETCAHEDSVEIEDGLPPIDTEELDSDLNTKSFDDIADELPYISILNSILPNDVRILAWCPSPSPDFSARFSCKERRYKYFFTNPAFLPTPGPIGLKNANGTEALVREGWLDIEAMKVAAKKLEGLHDFRNFCKIDPSKQMTSCERRITHATIEVARSQGGPNGFQANSRDVGSGQVLKTDASLESSFVDAPKVYTFNVHGSAFLWHQVRCMVAVLFLIGQGLEKPDLVDHLLNIEDLPNRPSYEMASDTPLVLWDCIFPDENSDGEDSLDWIYAGDAKTIAGLSTKSDGRLGQGGVVDELWTQWRKSKIDEVLSGSLLDLIMTQGDGSTLERGGFRDPAKVGRRSQKIFDGRDTGRLVGDYASVLNKPKLESMAVQNEKWRKRKGFTQRTNGHISIESQDD